MRKNKPVALSSGGDPHISPEQGYAPFKMGVKQNTATSIDLYLYGSIESSYYDYFTDEMVEGNSTDFFRRILFEENPKATHVNLFINSTGGEVFEGTAMANMLRRHPAKVTAIIDGFACSVASVIAMACDEVHMPNNALMMIHNMWTWAVGNADELRKMADDMDKMMEANRTIYIDKAGDKLTEDKLIEMLNAETWLTAEECLAYGFCDEIVGDVEVEDSTVKQLEQDMEKRMERIKAMSEVRYLAMEESPQGEVNPETADEGCFLMSENEEPEEPTQIQTYLSSFFERS